MKKKTKFPLKAFPTTELHYTVNRSDEWEHWEVLLADERATSSSYREGCMEHGLLLIREDVNKNGFVNYLVINKKGGVIVGNRRLCVARVLNYVELNCRVVEDDVEVSFVLEEYPYKHTNVI